MIPKKKKSLLRSSIGKFHQITVRSSMAKCGHLPITIVLGCSLLSWTTLLGLPHKEIVPLPGDYPTIFPEVKLKRYLKMRAAAWWSMEESVCIARFLVIIDVFQHFKKDGEVQQLRGLLLQLTELNLSNTPDTWNYTLDPSLLFSVASFRCHVESSCLSSSLDPIRWNKHLPIKVNIHAWRLCLDRLPTRVNLHKKGIDLDSVRCPVCDGDMETTKHRFIERPVAVELWNLVSTWWDVGDYPRDIQGLCSWADLVNLNSFPKCCFDVVIQTTFWVLWRFRNRVCFDAKPPRKDTLGDEIKVLSHSWILHRHKKANPTWFEWICNPNQACTNSL